MTALLYFTIFAAYHLIIFMIFRSFNHIFWISYGFMMAAFAIHLVCVFSIVKNLSVRAVFFGIPLFSFSIYFVCAEFFCSTVFMIFQKLAGVRVTILVQALLLCAFLVVAIVSIMTRDAVLHVDNKIRENVSFIKGIHVDIEMLMQRSTSTDVKSALEKLAETVKYSDPMSNSIVASQEQMIMQGMAELRDTFDAGDMEQTKALCEKLQLLFIERNKKLKISK